MRGFPRSPSPMRMDIKELCHGLPPSRAKGGHDVPGTSPDPAAVRLLLGAARCATTKTHRLVQVDTATVTDRGPRQGQHGEPRADHLVIGSGAKPEGKAAGHRYLASRGYGTRQRRAFPLDRGEGAGGGTAFNRNYVMNADILVPMPPFPCRGETDGPTVFFSLPKNSGEGC